MLLIQVALAPTAAAQQYPLYETRGVWFATVLRDGGWPASTLDPAAKQESDLRTRIQHARSLGLNTFVFQAVARGDAMYESSRLPWSARLRGAAQSPGYDPLAVAIDEAHRLGMELHAWINVNRVGDVSTVSDFQSASNPGHVYYEHPGWVQNVSGALWLDPSSPEARAWLVDNTVEIVANYDVDAIHFDFIRYPTGGLPEDLNNFQFDSRGFSDIGDWRRDNVTEFVRDVSTAVWAIEPWVKIGSAPFGNYQVFDGAWPASWALTDVFQESREWLAAGIHDYVAPQIYFDIGREPEPPNNYDSPDFSYLVDDWVVNSSGKPVFVGHGPYKPVVLEELDVQIDGTRSEAAAGQFFFRYDHIKNFDFVTSYPALSLPARMLHRFESRAPTTPTDLIAFDGEDASGNPTVTIEWTPSTGDASDPLGGYAIFRNEGIIPSTESGEHLVAYVWGDQATYTDPVPAKSAYMYQVIAVSRLGTSSTASNVATNFPVGVDRVAVDESSLRIESLHPNPTTDQLTVAYRAEAHKAIRVVVYDLVGRQVQSTDHVSAGNGINTLLLDVRGLAAGLYNITLQSPTRFVSEPFVVVR